MYRFHRAILVVMLLAANAAIGQEGISGFHNVVTKPQPVATVHEDEFGAVQTDKISLINLAPVLLPYFNNGPTFGVPGTETGNFWHRTQLSGDWGGTRTELARRGWFFDMYSTTGYQNVTSGGLETGGAVTQNLQYSVNLDTARAGLWSGGLIHFTAQSRYGDPPPNTFAAGTNVPQYMALVHPGPTMSNKTYPTEYFIVQAITKRTALVVGKISNIYIPDQTMFASSYKYHFANFNFLKNPMTPNFYNPTAWSALAIWAPKKSFALAGGVLDPNSQANNFASQIFNKVNLYLMSVITYKVGGRPGQVAPAFNWSNKPKLDLQAPYSTLAPTQVPQAVGALLGVAPTNGLQINQRKDSWFAITNASQYLYVKEDAATVTRKMKSGQLLRGVGLFGRLGYAPDKSNRTAGDSSIAVFAHGILDQRQYDSMGAGFYYNNISDPLKQSITRVTAGTLHANDEKGVEVFYDFALTPAIRVIPSYQHVWNPLTAEVAKLQDKADVFLLRVNMAW